MTGLHSSFASLAVPSRRKGPVGASLGWYPAGLDRETAFSKVLLKMPSWFARKIRADRFLLPRLLFVVHGSRHA